MLMNPTRCECNPTDQVVDVFLVDQLADDLEDLLFVGAARLDQTLPQFGFDVLLHLFGELLRRRRVLQVLLDVFELTLEQRHHVARHLRVVFWVRVTAV